MSATRPVDLAAIRAEFPILNESIYQHPLVYLDNAATTQKPLAVIEALDTYYRSYNSNVHRGVHYLSQKATDVQEAARHTVARFLNAGSDREVIFTRGTTESINMVAAGFGKAMLKAGDEVLVTGMEHHSNIVPWQLACEAAGAHLKVVPILEDGTLDMEQLDTLLNERTRIFAFTWVSNSLGTVNPVRELIARAHALDVPVLVDAAQAVQHLPVDVQELDIDFLAFSGHKIYGPTGIGVLYGKEKWLEALPPYQGGGSMIKTVRFEQSTWADLPFKFEAGTPHIAGAIGLGKAIEWLQQFDISAVAAAEKAVLDYAESVLKNIEGLRFIGTTKAKSATSSFLIEGVHPFDLGEILDKQGIAIRTGHHCCQPIMDHYNIPGTVRASFALYNTKQEAELLAEGIEKALRLLK